MHLSNVARIMNTVQCHSFCQVIMIVMNWGSQLSEMSSCSQKLTSFCDINHSLSCVIFPHNCFVFFFFNININAMSLSNRLRKMGVGYIGGWVDILVGGYIGGWDPTGLLLPSCCCCCCSCCSVYQSGKGDKKSVMLMLLSSKLRYFYDANKRTILELSV